LGRRPSNRAPALRRKAVAPAPTGAAASGSPRAGDLAWAAGLTLLAWVHRLFFLAANRDRAWPFTIFYEGDSETFFRYARTLLAGRLYDNGIPYHPPGFAWLLAGVHALAGARSNADEVPFVAVKAILALVASASVGLLYCLVRPYLGRVVALVTALLATWHFGLYVLAVAPVSEGSFLTLLLGTLLLWTRRFDHPLAAPAVPREAGREKEREKGGEKDQVGGGWPAAVALGVCGGLLALLRAESVLVFAVLLVVGLVGAWRRRRDTGWAAFRPWAIAAAMALLTVAPWTIRNAVRLGEVNQRLAGRLAEPLPTFVPLTIYGPLNLALANNARANGTFSRAALASSSSSDVLDLADPQHLRYLLHGDSIAWDWIRHNPGSFVRLVARKWALFFSAWKLGWTQWDLPGGLRGTRQPVDLFTPDSWWAAWIALPFTLLGLLYGLAIPGGPRRWAVLTLLLTAAGLFVTALFFGYVRQGLLALPFQLAWTATGLVGCAERVRVRAGGWSRALQGLLPTRKLFIGLATLAAALLALEAVGATANRNYQATGTNVEGRHILNRDAPVLLEVLP
jgi:hypothetical protein